MGGSLGDLVGGVDGGVVGGESGRGAELVVELGFEGEEFVAVGEDGEGGVVGGDGEELAEAADVLPLGEDYFALSFADFSHTRQLERVPLRSLNRKVARAEDTVSS